MNKKICSIMLALLLSVSTLSTVWAGEVKTPNVTAVECDAKADASKNKVVDSSNKSAANQTDKEKPVTEKPADGENAGGNSCIKRVVKIINNIVEWLKYFKDVTHSVLSWLF